MARQSTAKPALKRHGTGRQMDDNIDDLGRRPDGSLQEQPEGDQAKRVREGSVKPVTDEDQPERARQKHR